MPGLKRKKDGTRPGIGGRYRNRISLTRDEYLVLIEMWNRLADIGVDVRRRRLFDGEVVGVEVKPFIKKLLTLGERCGWIQTPCGYTPGWRK